MFFIDSIAHESNDIGPRKAEFTTIRIQGLFHANIVSNLIRFMFTAKKVRIKFCVIVTCEFGISELKAKFILFIIRTCRVQIILQIRK